jgi:hypothetical protein
MSIEHIACTLFAVHHIIRILNFNPRTDYLQLWHQKLVRHVTIISPVHIVLNKWSSTTSELLGSWTKVHWTLSNLIYIYERYKHAWTLLAFLVSVCPNSLDKAALDEQLFRKLYRLTVFICLYFYNCTYSIDDHSTWTHGHICRYTVRILMYTDETEQWYRVYYKSSIWRFHVLHTSIFPLISGNSLKHEAHVNNIK